MAPANAIIYKTMESEMSYDSHATKSNTNIDSQLKLIRDTEATILFLRIRLMEKSFTCANEFSGKNFTHPTKHCLG